MAEDEENISDFVRRGLAGFGYEVTVSEDGTQAWQLLNGKSSDFDLVLLDIRMPGLSGFEVCRRLREQQGYSLPCSCSQPSTRQTTSWLDCASVPTTISSSPLSLRSLLLALKRFCVAPVSIISRQP